MIVPKTLYRTEVFYDYASNRWKARFHSEKPEGIRFAFPLPDLREGTSPRSVLLMHEEELLALTFNQMVHEAVQSMARMQMDKAAAEEPESKTEAELVD